MADFRLKVFYAVAQRLSFTRASQELFISQPAVTRHVKELEEEYKARLFVRRGNAIQLTAAGQILMKHCQQIMAAYREAESEIHKLNDLTAGSLTIGASTTIAQYVIPACLARFHLKYPEVKLSLKNGNTEEIERCLLNKEIDLGFIEGDSKNPEIHYMQFAQDEIVLVCRADHPMTEKASVSITELSAIPLVLRERGSGTLEVIEHALQRKGINLQYMNIEMHLDSTEAIKSYLMHSSCMALISIHAVGRELANNQLRIIDLEALEIKRAFYCIHPQGKADKLTETFMRFSTNLYNQGL